MRNIMHFIVNNKVSNAYNNCSMNLNKYISKIEDMSNRHIVIAGGTNGVGFELLKHLISKNASIILLARNLDKANKIKEQYPSANIEIIQYNQASFKSIEHACDELVKNHKEVDTIVLNAGELTSKGLTEENYSLTIGVNYIGVKRFIDYISPKLTSRVRFVIQGSIVAGLRLSKNHDLTYQKYGVFKQYNISKIYVEAYFYKLFTDNKYPNIEYVLTEPGISSTGIIRHFNAFIRVAGKWFLKIFFHSPKKASLTLLTGVSHISQNGDYIVPRGLFTMSGYPKIQKLPVKRQRLYLFNK